MASVKLTPAQRKMLDRICRTNGGGVSTVSINGTEQRVLDRLHELDLVQGKSGCQWIAVHTRDGLNLWRSQA